jgi:inositol hexakisphosphate/diphosphoinositol-pentakisphosphate kinase
VLLLLLDVMDVTARSPVKKHCLGTKTSPPREAGSLTMDSSSHHQPLVRTLSTESTSAISTATWQPGSKAQVSEPQTGTESIEVKLSPYGTDALAPLRPLGLTTRRPSKASDHLREYFGRTSIGGSAIDEEFEDKDVDATPLAGARYPSALASSLSEAKSRSDVDSAEKRLSFSSLYSIGSAIYANTRGHSWSGRSSVVGSEPECQSSRASASASASHWVMARVHR